MTTSLVFTFILLTCTLSIWGHRLGSICGDPARGTVLCVEIRGDSSFVYEFDASTRTQINSHNISAPNGQTQCSSFVYANSTLYQVLSYNEGTSIQAFDLPLPNDHAGALDPNSELLVGNGFSTIPTCYDTDDGCAFSIVGRDLTFIDLNSFNVLNSVRVLQGSRKIASSIVYDHDQNHVIVFTTSVRNYANGTVYNLQALEYKACGRQLEPLISTFENSDPLTGPFANSVLTAGQVDYDHDKIWFLDSPNLRLVGFENANLSAPCQFISLPSQTTFYTYSHNVVWDFADMHAYVISDISDGFVVHDVSLEEGFEDWHVYKARYPVASVHLDLATRNLYLGLDDEFEFGPSDESLSTANDEEYPYGEIDHSHDESWRLKRQATEYVRAEGEPNLAIVNLVDYAVQFVYLAP